LQAVCKAVKVKEDYASQRDTKGGVPNRELLSTLLAMNHETTTAVTKQRPLRS